MEKLRAERKVQCKYFLNGFCKNVCACMHTYTHYAYIHTLYIHYTCRLVYNITCMGMHIHIHIHTFTLCMSTHSHVPACVHACIHPYTIHTHTYIHTYTTCMHIHIRTCYMHVYIHATYMLHACYMHVLHTHIHTLLKKVAPILDEK